MEVAFLRDDRQVSKLNPRGPAAVTSTWRLDTDFHVRDSWRRQVRTGRELDMEIKRCVDTSGSCPVVPVTITRTLAFLQLYTAPSRCPPAQADPHTPSFKRPCQEWVQDIPPFVQALNLVVARC